MEKAKVPMINPKNKLDSLIQKLNPYLRILVTPLLVLVFGLMKPMSFSD